MGPELIALLATQLASAGIGALRAKNAPEAPNLISPAVSQGQAARGRLLRDQDRTLQELTDAQLSEGLQGTSTTERVIRGTAEGLADIDAQIASSVTDAANRQSMLEYQKEMNKYSGQNQAIAQLLQAGGILAGEYFGGSGSENPLTEAAGYLTPAPLENPATPLAVPTQLPDVLPANAGFQAAPLPEVLVTAEKPELKMTPRPPDTVYNDKFMEALIPLLVNKTY